MEQELSEIEKIKQVMNQTIHYVLIIPASSKSYHKKEFIKKHNFNWNRTRKEWIKEVFEETKANEIAKALRKYSVTVEVHKIKISKKGKK